jgi:hypothetical protein
MFQRLTFNGQDISDRTAMILLDVTAEYGVTTHEHMWGPGRKDPATSTARAEAWLRMNEDHSMGEIARLFGVSTAAVSYGIKRRIEAPERCSHCGKLK